jgi:hypothetical protein
MPKIFGVLATAKLGVPKFHTMRKIIAFALLILLSIQMCTTQAACNIFGGKPYGDCSGVTVRNGEKPSLRVRSSVIESAIVAGATVYPGGSLELSGISNGDIVVKSGGRLFVTGTVNGAIRNDGGSVEIEGIVTHLASNGGSATIGGQLDSFSGSGPVLFKKGAIFHGAPLNRAMQLPRPHGDARQQ